MNVTVAFTNKIDNQCLFYTSINGVNLTEHSNRNFTDSTGGLWIEFFPQHFLCVLFFLPQNGFANFNICEIYTQHGISASMVQKKQTKLKEKITQIREYEDIKHLAFISLPTEIFVWQKHVNFFFDVHWMEVILSAWMIFFSYQKLTINSSRSINTSNWATNKF